MVASEKPKSEYTVALVRYVPDIAAMNSVCVAVLLVGTVSGGGVLTRRLSNWEHVLLLDPEADVPLLIDIVEELKAACARDPQFLERTRDWVNAVQVSLILHLSTASPEQELDGLFHLYCEKPI